MRRELFSSCLSYMAPNGTAHPAPAAGLAPGHFLFTSESVGEGHPGMLNASCLLSGGKR